MKKSERSKEDELRPEYDKSDFPGGMVRGKYAERLRESSNIVVIDPEVSKAFPNEQAVNEALMSLIKIAKASTFRKKSASTHSAVHK